MTAPHRFWVGQLVRLVRRPAVRNAVRIFEVLALLPEIDGEPRYRVRSYEAGTAEVGEGDLVAASQTGKPRP